MPTKSLKIQVLAISAAYESLLTGYLGNNPVEGFSNSSRAVESTDLFNSCSAVSYHIWLEQNSVLTDFQLFCLLFSLKYRLL